MQLWPHCFTLLAHIAVSLVNDPCGMFISEAPPTLYKTFLWLTEC